MRTAPASASFLQRTLSGLVVVVVPLARCVTVPSHQIVTPIFLRFSPAATSSAVGVRQYRQQTSSSVPTMRVVHHGGVLRLRVADASISPAASSSTRAWPACQQLLRRQLLDGLPAPRACTVGVPSSLNDLRFMTGTTAPSGSSRQTAPLLLVHEDLAQQRREVGDGADSLVLA